MSRHQEPGEIWIVIPLHDHPDANLPRSGAATVLLNSLAKLAHRFLWGPVRLCAYHAPTRKVVEMPSGQPLDLPLVSHGLAHFSSAFRRSRSVITFVNPALLLCEHPTLWRLGSLSHVNGIACCGLPGTKDLYAFAVAQPMRRERWEQVHELLRWLTAEPDEIQQPSDRVTRLPMLPPALFYAGNSTAMAGIEGARCARGYDAPRYLSSALAEICFHPADMRPVHGDPLRMAQSLMAQVPRSRVPWIFNELANEIDYRCGTTEPFSLPPELHLATTGLCNLECRFCSYSHGHARPDLVTVEMMQRWKFLPSLRALRLSSGNGEPTVNPHLPALIKWLASAFPHLGLSFFTNGVMLDRGELISTLVDEGVAWISVSLNAASRQSWSLHCGADSFDRVCRNLRQLLAEKRARRSCNPLVFGSMVLTRSSAAELPLMPALCRQLGIDRFTAIPFFALGYSSPDRYGPDQLYHNLGEQYGRLYDQTVTEAGRHRVSVELPLPSARKSAAFGVEARPVHDYAQLECDGWRVSRLLCDLPGMPSTSYCPSLWRQAAVACTAPDQSTADVTHYLYPCVGPLATVDMASRTSFSLGADPGFPELWRNPLLAFLRQAQGIPGECPVCDFCRDRDTRDPQLLSRLSELVRDFASERNLDARRE